MDINLIQQDIVRYRQGWRARRTVEYSGHKMRATVYQDFYERQSEYYLELFSPRELKFNRVFDAPAAEWYERLPGPQWRPFVDTNKHEQNVNELIEFLFAYGQDLLEGVELEH